MLVGTTSSKYDDPNLDIGKAYDPPRIDKDIGNTVLKGPPSLPCDLESAEQTVLKQLYDIFGDRHLSEHELQFAPRWVLDKSIANEKANYIDVIEEISLSDPPRDSNIISSHHFFQLKHDGEEGRLKLKCRLVPHGNRDKEKDSVRKDSTTAQFPVIRVVLSIAAFLGMILATIDVKGAYLQGGYLSRDIYVRPPKGWASARRVVWRLLKAAYGIVEAGRIWQRTVETWMLEQGMETVPGLPRLFIKRRPDGRIVLVMAKVTDDFLIAGLREDIKGFYRSMAKRFKIGRFVIDKYLIFNRLHIRRTNDGAILVNMQEYFDKVMKLEIPRTRRKETEAPCTKEELTAYLGLAGKLNFLGHGILPQAAYVASRMQQAVGRLKVSDLINANSMLRELQNLKPNLTYSRATELNASPIYLAFSDASHGSHSYGQTGYVSGMYLSAGGESLYHVLDWHSSKQSRVSFSSVGAEIIAAASATDRAALMSESLGEVYGSQHPPTLVLTVDSNGLYSTITTLHEGMDYRLRPTVSRLRDSFEVGEIGLMQWIPGKLNPADALTKRNVQMYRLLNDTMARGTLDMSIFRNQRESSSHPKAMNVYLSFFSSTLLPPWLTMPGPEYRWNRSANVHNTNKDRVPNTALQRLMAEAQCPLLHAIEYKLSVGINEDSVINLLAIIVETREAYDILSCFAALALAINSVGSKGQRPFSSRRQDKVYVRLNLCLSRRAAILSCNHVLNVPSLRLLQDGGASSALRAMVGPSSVNSILIMLANTQSPPGVLQYTRSAVSSPDFSALSDGLRAPLAVRSYSLSMLAMHHLPTSSRNRALASHDVSMVRVLSAFVRMLYQQLTSGSAFWEDG